MSTRRIDAETRGVLRDIALITAGLAVLKLSGLDMSWWWVAAPVLFTAAVLGLAAAL
jgi:hypothetical protein